MRSTVATPRLRSVLEEGDLADMLAVKATQLLWAAGEHGPGEVPARELIAGLPARAWRRRSAGDGAKASGSMTDQARAGAKGARSAFAG
jgi:hypothetical protein